ncbi:hypothetical protein [Streptomyces enissocaesilis]|uniref:Uncharacterized protein n=1 Tax=Streptomyces enissocaesilis TaxID=332589 RepID=A0ABN3XHY0_9ACTN
MRSLQFALCAGVAAAVVVTPAATAHAGDGAEGRIAVTPSTIAPGGEVDLRVDVCKGGKATGTSDAFSTAVHFSPAPDRGALFTEAHIRSDAQPKEYEIRVKCKDGGQAKGTVTVVRPDKPGQRPDKSGQRPDQPDQSGQRPDQPGQRPDQRPEENSGQRPGQRPDQNSDQGPDRHPDQDPGQRPEHRPDQDPGQYPDHRPGQRPDNHPGQGPDHRPDHRSDQRPDHHPTPHAPVHAGGGGTAQLAAAEEDGPGTPHTVIGLVLAGVAAVAVAYRSARRRRTDTD